MTQDLSMPRTGASLSARALLPTRDANEARSTTRLASIDQLRGLAIVFMALDHVRDYFTSAHFSPTDLSKTTVALFLTRWVTHFCAPIFVFLAGVSARLMSQHVSRGALSRFLLGRGLWLVVLEFTVLTVLWSVNFEYRMGLVMQVISAIGMAMCALGGLVSVPAFAICALRH